jgi:hypothetical protein
MVYRNPSHLPLLTSPLGIDRSIQELQKDLYLNCSWLQYSFGRAFIGNDKQSKRDYQYPAVYKGQKSYQDASPNDNLMSQSFFIVDDEYTYEEYDIFSLNKPIVPVSLIIWGNLEKISPSSNEMFSQVLLQDTLRVIRDSTEWRVNKITDNHKDVFSEFSVRDSETHLFYYPYFCYRVYMETSVQEECDTDIDDAKQLYGI